MACNIPVIIQNAGFIEFKNASAALLIFAIEQLCIQMSALQLQFLIAH
ncbi:MAG: hypothetical protein HRT37_24770 [Alteromonadaceae bacterium]|nr:hypothetical protein [Alteromonadaceae bacterium]